MAETSHRRKVLEAAADMIDGDRRDSYGEVLPGFTKTAALWSEVLDVDVTPEQVAMCMILLKVSRLTVSPDHQDSWTDIAGYAGLGAEVNVLGEENIRNRRRAAQLIDELNGVSSGCAGSVDQG